jgi:8-oxo-dGTP pyrophosphatase MutT (NUDIX family)
VREAREEIGLDVSVTIVALGYRYTYRLNPARATHWHELYTRDVTHIPVETFAAEAHRDGLRQSIAPSTTNTPGAGSMRRRSD